MAAVGGNCENGTDREPAVCGLGGDAAHHAAFFDEAVCLRPHHKPKGGIKLRLAGQEIEKIPLWHQGDELRPPGQMREIAENDRLVTDLSGELPRFLMRQREEFVEQAEIVHRLERGGMNRVAAEIAQKVGMLLEHDRLDPGACQQKAKHHAGRAAAYHATGCLGHHPRNLKSRTGDG